MSASTKCLTSRFRLCSSASPLKKVRTSAE
ncbi:Uncharacterised protein [Vibrio cholerae]|nr:Uncharacterised protein [Vibrio cholerae]